MSRVLIYCGLNHGGYFTGMVTGQSYDLYYGFEANPVLCEKVQKKCASYQNVKVINGVLSNTHDELVDFYIQDANSTHKDYCSSVGKITKEYHDMSSNIITLQRTVKVKTINLYTFIQKEGITNIDFLLTDLEGSDLTVLKTLKPLIDGGVIKKIRSEVELDHMPVRFEGLNNKLCDFKELLGSKYRLAKKTKASDLAYERAAPKDYFSVDCEWILDEGIEASNEWPEEIANAVIEAQKKPPKNFRGKNIKKRILEKENK